MAPRPRPIPPAAEELLKEFKDHLEELGRADNTIKGYLSDLRDFAHHLDGRPLWPVPLDLEGEVQKWLGKRRAEGISLQSVRRRIFAVKGYYHFAGVPDALSGIISPRAQFYLPKILAVPEVDRLFGELKSADPESHDFYRLILLSGFRFDELFRVSACATDAEDKLLTVTEESGRARTVQLGSQAAVLVAALAERGGKWRRNKHHLQRMLKRCASTAGIGRITAQMLRSTCAARLFASNHTTAFVKGNLGYRADITVRLVRKVAREELIENYHF